MTRRSIGWIAACALLVVTTLPMAAPAAAGEADALEAVRLEDFPHADLTILRGVVKQRIDVWVADTPIRQQRGLMFVKEMEPDRGMIFVYPQPRMLMMWMKNTFIELDMLFVDERGRINHIIANARPLSEKILATPLPASMVIELKGGEARRRGIVVGDRVSVTQHGESPSR